ncbi:LPS export ABC transporter periplasmic protein LptC [uncultured Empedobacter sp.]|uniref:LPS export ABC transporter periplasmic protein LptC n=1 Tax=uncultured Empedobacter sp. TaxID=410844 RepID=UPI00262158AF|nr:LPS export ABC transporter periplasmic protein LptC [uncultured Empedobacter sp.]
MKKEDLNNILKGALAFVFITTMSSCNNDMKNIQKWNKKQLIPSGEAKNMLVRYTDSAKIKAELASEIMYDYSAAKYPFNYFPTKVFIKIYDENKKTTLVEANRATSYNKTKIIELVGDVKITTHDQKVLETQQLFFDQQHNWFFTENYFKITDPDKSFFEGIGLDFDTQFKIINAQQNRGELKNKNNEDI